MEGEGRVGVAAGVKQQQLKKNHLVEEDVDTVACPSTICLTFFFNQLLTVFIILRRQVTGHSMLHVAHAVSTLSPYWMSLFTVSGHMNSFCSTWTKTEFTFEFISEPNGRIGVASASRNWIEIWNNLAFFLNELCTESSENEYCTFKVISKYGSSRENAAGALYALIRHRCKSEFL